MAPKRPTLRLLPTSNHARARQFHRDIKAIIHRNLEEACERAWAEVAERFGRKGLLPEGDRATTSARRAMRALISVMANAMGRLALAAIVLPAVVSAARRRSDVVPPLASIPGGLRRNGHAADGWVPGDPSSSR